MSDQCKHCTERGDPQACKATPCQHHENWYAMVREELIEKAREELTQWLEDMDDYTDAQYGKGQIRSILEGVCGKQ